MKKIRSKWLLLLFLIIGTFIQIFRGTEARQKWVFKMKNKYQEKRQIAEQRQVALRGGVTLDEIELSAFHKN